MTSSRNTSPRGGSPPEFEPPGAVRDDAVLMAARSLALDVGYRRTTIADVARRAGLSRMTVYRQYEDLNAIWSALLTTELVAMLQAEATRAATLPTGRERLVAAASALPSGIAAHPLFRRALDLDPEMLLPLVVDRLGSSQRAVLVIVEEQITLGQADGSVRPMEPTTGALAVLLAAQSFVFSARVIAGSTQGDAVWVELPEFIDRYLRP